MLSSILIALVCGGLERKKNDEKRDEEEDDDLDSEERTLRKKRCNFQNEIQNKSLPKGLEAK